MKRFLMVAAMAVATGVGAAIIVAAVDLAKLNDITPSKEN